MPSLRLNLIMASTVLCLVGCARPGNPTPAAHEKDYNELSSQLKKDMSEEEVAAAIGSAPNKMDLVTCVDHAGSPWQCKTWIYYGGRPRNSLRLVFYQSDHGIWRSVSWQVY
jgi:hypothetical protein